MGFTHLLSALFKVIIIQITIFIFGDLESIKYRKYEQVQQQKKSLWDWMGLILNMSTRREGENKLASAVYLFQEANLE